MTILSQQEVHKCQLIPYLLAFIDIESESREHNKITFSSEPSLEHHYRCTIVQRPRVN